MNHRAAHDAKPRSRPSHRRFAGRATAAALMLFGPIAMSTGCQSPAMKGSNLARATHASTSASPNGNAGAHNASNAASTAGTPAATDAVAQVGFVQRMQARAAGQCGGCRGCQSGSACQQPGVLAGPIMLGRPVDPQEYLCNGGDVPPQARVLRDDSVGGVEPQDAIVHYTTDAGEIEVLPSNRVCVYSPRFGAIRQISGAVAGEKAIGLQGTSLPVGANGIGLTQPSLTVQDVHELARADVAKRVDSMRDRNRGVPVEGVVQPVLAAEVLEILATLDAVSLNRLDESQILLLQQGALAARSWMIRDAVEVMIESMQPPVLTRDARVEAFVEYDFPDAGRLQIGKVADKEHARQGEEVTFAIHVRNVGDSAVNQVEIVDSLVTRLEYVEGSQSCDREAAFETSGNAAGSVKLKWTLVDRLEVGESAQIEFKCRVR